MFALRVGYTTDGLMMLHNSVFRKVGCTYCYFGYVDDSGHYDSNPCLVAFIANGKGVGAWLPGCVLRLDVNSPVRQE